MIETSLDAKLTRERRRSVYAWLFWLGVLALIASSVSSDITLKQFDVRPYFRMEPTAHLVGCGVLAWLHAMAYGVSTRTVIVLLLLAGLSEGIQYFVEGRSAELDDTLYNALGILAGLIIYMVRVRRVARNTVPPRLDE